MRGFKSNIDKDTLGNKNFRKVLYTGHDLQLVIMRLGPGEEIGEETHNEGDQFFRIEKGEGKGVVDNNDYPLQEGDALLVPAGARHNVMNTSKDEDLQFYTLYAPPQHKDGIVRSTKKEAEDNEEHFDGKTTEPRTTGKIGAPSNPKRLIGKPSSL